MKGFIETTYNNKPVIIRKSSIQAVCEGEIPEWSEIYMDNELVYKVPMSVKEVKEQLTYTSQSATMLPPE